MVVRNRLIYFCFIVIVVILGILSRRFGEKLPAIIADYSGDILWALMIFLLFGLIFIKLTSLHIALLALLFAFVIEFSQLYQSDWINFLRNTQLGGLVLGYGFLWSDLICYTIGIIIGVCLEKTFLNKRKNKVI